MVSIGSGDEGMLSGSFEVIVTNKPDEGLAGHHDGRNDGDGNRALVWTVLALIDDKEDWEGGRELRSRTLVLVEP